MGLSRRELRGVPAAAELARACSVMRPVGARAALYAASSTTLAGIWGIDRLCGRWVCSKARNPRTCGPGAGVDEIQRFTLYQG